MRILLISSFYPPNVIGGAEICAQNLANAFTARGHEVGVLTAAPTPEGVGWRVPVDGYSLYRVATHHLYPVAAAPRAPAWQKPIWHLQDLFDPRNRQTIDRVIGNFAPDIIHIHWIQGLGYNGLEATARRDVPTLITLHDLALVCVRTTMFRGTDECPRPCAMCRFSADRKRAMLSGIRRLGFISPSQANLDTVARLLPIEDRPSWHIPNPTRYPAPAPRKRMAGEPLRLLFVGRIEATKGVDFAFEQLAPLAERHDFTFTVMGKGPSLEALTARYGHLPWVRIMGHVPLQTVADEMANSDLLLVPSLWKENSPGVVFQALGTGLPIMASDRGGLPELIEPGVNGYLLPAGDAVAWQEAVASVLAEPGQLAPLRAGAIRAAAAYDPDLLADRMLDAYRHVDALA